MRRHRDTRHSLSIRSKYRSDNAHCELSAMLKHNGLIEYIDEGRVEIHHIVGGSGRVDLVSNLIALSPYVHRLVEQMPIVGRIACLIIKASKNEIEPLEYQKCSGQRLLGWLANHESDVPGWMIEMYDELMLIVEEIEWADDE